MFHYRDVSQDIRSNRKVNRRYTKMRRYLLSQRSASNVRVVLANQAVQELTELTFQEK